MLVRRTRGGYYMLGGRRISAAEGERLLAQQQQGARQALQPSGQRALPPGGQPLHTASVLPGMTEGDRLRERAAVRRAPGQHGTLFPGAPPLSQRAAAAPVHSVGSPGDIPGQMEFDFDDAQRTRATERARRRGYLFPGMVAVDNRIRDVRGASSMGAPGDVPGQSQFDFEGDFQRAQEGRDRRAQRRAGRGRGAVRDRALNRLPWMSRMLMRHPVASAVGGIMGLPIAANLLGPMYSSMMDPTGPVRKELAEHKETEAAARAMGMRAQSLQRSMQQNMARLAAMDPQMYNSVMAGRRLPKGAAVFGGRMRQDLMEELSMQMALGQFGN